MGKLKLHNLASTPPLLSHITDICVMSPFIHNRATLLFLSRKTQQLYLLAATFISISRWGQVMKYKAFIPRADKRFTPRRFKEERQSCNKASYLFILLGPLHIFSYVKSVSFPSVCIIYRSVNILLQVNYILRVSGHVHLMISPSAPHFKGRLGGLVVKRRIWFQEFNLIFYLLEFLPAARPQKQQHVSNVFTIALQCPFLPHYSPVRLCVFMLTSVCVCL